MPFDDSEWRPFPPEKDPWETLWETLLAIARVVAVLLLFISFGALVGIALGSLLEHKYAVVARAPLWVKAVAGMIGALCVLFLQSWYEERQARKAQKRGERVLDLRKNFRL